MKPAEFLHTHALFTREELEHAVTRSGARAPATLTKHLQTWRKEGRVLPIRRGVYVRSSNGSPSAVDPLALASRLAPDAVLAYHTALEVHGFAQSMFQRLFFATWSKTRSLRYEGMEYVPVRPRAALAKSRDAFVTRVTRGDVEVRVTSRERTLVDVLDRPDLAGGMEEVWRSLEHVPVLDFKPLERYVTLIQRPVLAARLGFLLEVHAARWATPDDLLSRLEKFRPRGPVSLEGRRAGRLVKRWNLIVPPNLPPQENTGGTIP